jgi:hypothetical protein
MAIGNAVKFLLVAFFMTSFAAGLGAEEYPRFNTRIGTQTFVPAYQFDAPQSNKLIETVHRIHELGSGVVKFEMSDRVQSVYGVPTSGVSSLVELYNTPSYQWVFDQPFDTFIFWAYPFGMNALNNPWGDGYSPSEAATEYDQLRALTEALRNDPRLDGKEVLIGFWEGDNALRNSSGDPNHNPGATRISGMKDWIRNRQQAIADGRAATPDSSVGVYNYAEVNLVLQTQWDPRYITVLRNVFDDPTVIVDLISYSCWDVSTVGDDNALDGFLTWSLNEIRNRGNFSGAYPHPVPVFIGEHGRPRRNAACTEIFTAQSQRTGSRAIIQSALRFNCPYVLYWQIYNNETVGGCQLGYWLIDNANVRQPVWYEHNDFLAKANILRNQTRLWLQRNPTDAEFIGFGSNYESLIPSDMLNTLLDGQAIKQVVGDEEFVALLMEVFNGDPEHEDGPNYLSLLQTVPRSQVLNLVMDGEAFQSRVPDADFARYLYEGTLMRSPGMVTEPELAAALDALQSTPRSALWRMTFLNSEEFLQGELLLREINERKAAVVTRRHFFDFTILQPSYGELIQIY